MDAINERFKTVYKTSGLSQEAFAKAIKRGRGEISNIIYGKNAPKENVVDAVCEVFGVRKAWLMSGEGDMYEPKTREEEVAEIVGKTLNGSNDFKLAVIRMICSRTDEELKVIESALRTMLDTIKKDTAD